MRFGKPAAPARCLRRALGLGAAVLVAIAGAPAVQARAQVSSATSAAAATAPAAPRARQGEKKRRPPKKDGRSMAHAASKTKSRPASKPPASAPAGAASGDGLPFSLGRPSNVTPNQTGRIVVFPFRNDDGGALSLQVGQLLAARGLDVMSDVKPVDSAEQYRDMATALGLVAYVDGDVRGSDANARATVRIRSGYSGRKVAEVSFKESRENLPREISDRLWTKLGPSVAHACVDAAKPRKKSRTTLEINAGTPIETVPRAPPPHPSSADQAPGTGRGHGTTRIPDAKPPAPAASAREPKSA
jgi:hypothetical protein